MNRSWFELQGHTPRGGVGERQQANSIGGGIPAYNLEALIESAMILQSGCNKQFTHFPELSKAQCYWWHC